MIEEMFLQIDYNGDGGCDWDEFTTFLSITGLGSGPRGAHKKEGDGVDINGEAVLNEYVITYTEDLAKRDKFLSSQKEVWSTHYFPDNRRLAVVNKNSDRVMIVDEHFNLITTIECNRLSSAVVGSKVRDACLPFHSSFLTSFALCVGSLPPPQFQTHPIAASSIAVVPGAAANEMAAYVYDVAYLGSRSTYALTTSDHALTLLREVQVGVTVCVCVVWVWVCCVLCVVCVYVYVCVLCGCGCVVCCVCVCVCMCCPAIQGSPLSVTTPHHASPPPLRPSIRGAGWGTACSRS